jgi:hypothetical protein
VLLGGYLLWASLFFAVEGAAHWACRVPGRPWIERGADAQERLARNLRYRKSIECLEAARWRSVTMDALFTIALVLPCVPLALYARRVTRRGWLYLFDEPAFAYGAVYVLGAVLALLPYGAALLTFERVGFVGP